MHPDGAAHQQLRAGAREGGEQLRRGVLGEARHVDHRVGLQGRDTGAEGAAGVLLGAVGDDAGHAVPGRMLPVEPLPASRDGDDVVAGLDEPGDEVAADVAGGTDDDHAHAVMPGAPRAGCGPQPSPGTWAARRGRIRSPSSAGATIASIAATARTPAITRNATRYGSRPPTSPAIAVPARSATAPTATPSPAATCWIVEASVFASVICTAGTSANATVLYAVKPIERAAPPKDEQQADQRQRRRRGEEGVQHRREHRRERREHEHRRKPNRVSSGVVAGLMPRLPTNSSSHERCPASTGDQPKPTWNSSGSRNGIAFTPSRNADPAGVREPEGADPERRRLTSGCRRAAQVPDRERADDDPDDGERRPRAARPRRSRRATEPRAVTDRDGDADEHEAEHVEARHRAGPPRMSRRAARARRRRGAG